MFRTIISRFISFIASAFGGMTLHCQYAPKKKEHSSDNAVSKEGVIANLANDVGSFTNNGNLSITINAPSQVDHEIILSEQAKRVLVELLNSNESQLLYLRMPTNQREVRQLNLQKGSIGINTNTIDADMNDLVEAGYLRKSETSNKHTLHYELTHKGREYARKLSEAKTE